MSLFKKKKSIVINSVDPMYKVKYLGNVMTSMMKGDGCVDKPIAAIWNNYLRNPSPPLSMEMTITSYGLKATTKTQDPVEYRAHRITYCIAHPSYPKLFIWVYRHDSSGTGIRKKMKLEIRCHAVLCKTEAKAKAIAVQLHESISFALQNFMREKTRRQNARLTLQRTNSLPMHGSVVPKRTQMLSTGQNFKPPISKSNAAPKLGAIHEDKEAEHRENIIEEEEEDEDTLIDDTDGDDADGPLSSPTLDALTLHGHDRSDLENAVGLDGLIMERIIDIEIGNDIEELKMDGDVQDLINGGGGDSDDESSESGFHEPDSKESSVGTVDEASLDGDEAVCELPSGFSGAIAEETEVTSL